MKALVSLIMICLLCGTSCRPPTGSRFLATFNPVASMNKVGSPEGISYFNGSAGSSSHNGLFSGVRIDKDWTFRFQGSHMQLSKQLNQLRAEVESQLKSSGCAISGHGQWSGGFSGFSFDYSSGRLRGFIRVSGVTFESGTQGLEIILYEH